MITTLLLALAVAPPDPAAFDAVTGYRIAHYRSVVPAPPPGVPRIADDEAAVLQGEGALFIDVMPAPGAQRDATGAWHLAEPRDSIPGAHGFPEAGRGDAGDAIDRWLLRGVKRLAHGRSRRTIVVFCLADCWMSWNGALKLARAGFRDVRWYADGTDGWRDIGRPLLPAAPERR